MTQPLRINLHGGPGSGKSTLAARLFADLKSRASPKLELVQEAIKPWAWEGRAVDGYDQVYLFGKQLRAENRLLRLGVSVITDSPLQMQVAYATRGLSGDNTSPAIVKSLGDLACSFDEMYPHLNLLLKRSVPYRRQGRYETEEGAMEMDRLIENRLWDAVVDFREIDPVSDYDNALETCLRRLEKQPR